MPTKEPFIATVFLEPSSTAEVLAADLRRHITDATGQAPVPVQPNKTFFVMLIEGEYQAIVKALTTACRQHDERWLLSAVGTPCTANGLASAAAWIRSRSGGLEPPNHPK